MTLIGNRLLRSAGTLALGTAVAQIASAALLALVAHVSSPADFGLAVGSVGLATVMANLVDFGSTQKAARDLASGAAREEDFARTVRRKLTLLLIVGSVWVLVLMSGMVHAIQPGLASLSLLGVLLFSRTLTLAANWLLTAKREFVRASLVVITDRYLGLVCGVGLYVAGWHSAWMYPTAMSMGSLAAVLIHARRLRAGLFGRFVATEIFSLRAYRSFAAFGLMSVATDLLLLDVFFVGLTAGQRQAGLVGAASRVVLPITLVGAALANSGLVRLADGTQRDQEASWLRQATVFAGVMSGAALAIAAVTVPLWIAPVLGPGFEGAASVVRIYCVTALINVCSQPIGASLQARGHERLATMVVVPGVVLCIVGLTVGGAIHGATGAAVGNLVGTALTLLGLVLAARSTQHGGSRSSAAAPSPPIAVTGGTEA